MTDAEQIKNWLRINRFKVWDAAEEGSLTAQHLLNRLEELQGDPKNKLALESLPRLIDTFERAWVRRQALKRLFSHKLIIHL